MYPAAGMLVMAIEAANQIAENRHVVGYEIKDATFHAPLNIPSNSDGVETQFYLRPLRDASDKSNACFQFRLCVCEDGNWAETCRGTVQVEYEGIETEVDGGKEAKEVLRSLRQVHENAARSCTRAVDSKYMYER